MNAPFAASAQGKVEKVAPRDELEENLTKFASEVFGAAEPIGIRDNFFDVGANSPLIVNRENALMHHEIQLQRLARYDLSLLKKFSIR